MTQKLGGGQSWQLVSFVTSWQVSEKVMNYMRASQAFAHASLLCQYSTGFPLAMDTYTGGQLMSDNLAKLPTVALDQGEDHYPDGRQVFPVLPPDVEVKVQARLRSRARRQETVMELLAQTIAMYGLRDVQGFTRLLARNFKRLDREVYGEELHVIEQWLGRIHTF